MRHNEVNRRLTMDLMNLYGFVRVAAQTIVISLRTAPKVRGPTTKYDEWRVWFQEVIVTSNYHYGALHRYLDIDGATTELKVYFDSFYFY